MIITIDGPTASGKGFIAKELARLFGMQYMDTGALYRAVGLLARDELGKDAVAAGAAWTQELVTQFVSRITYAYRAGSAHITIDGHDVTAQLRSPESDWYASHVSSVALVRDALREMQRSMGTLHDLVIDGRDCGTVIFPAADYKFFITASLETRVQRAHDDAARRASGMSRETVREAVMQRDMRDLLRPISPLRPAPDAIILDTTMLGKEAVMALVLGYIVR